MQSIKPNHETGVWKIEYPTALRQAVGDFAIKWELFCALPHEVQDIFTAGTTFNSVGFERKIGTGTAESRNSRDNKLNFDVTKAGIGELEKLSEKIQDQNARLVAQDFIFAAKDLTHYASPAIEEFGKIIESSYGVSGFQDLAAASAQDAFFRAIYYPPAERVGKVIGDTHVDNSGITLHFGESTEGCEWLDPDKQTWHPMPVAEGYALAFPSMQTQLYSNGEIDGLCHRILSNETTCQLGRYAIVCFVPLVGVAPYDRERHGRLQDRVPGFNYGMDPVEFAGNFKS